MADLFRLCLAASRMQADIKPNLQNICNRHTIMLDCCSKTRT